MIVITNGLRIDTLGASYLIFQPGPVNSVTLATDGVTLVITFIPGSTSDDIAATGSAAISLVTPGWIITETPYHKCTNPLFQIGDFIFKKIVQGLHAFRQYLVDDIPSQMYQDEGTTIILINPEEPITVYQNILSQLIYIQPTFIPPVFVLDNWEVMVNDKKTDIKVIPQSQFIYKSKAFYDDYTLKTVDVLNAFFTNLENILKPEGIDLLARTENEMSLSDNYIQYRILDAPLQNFYKSNDDFLKRGTEEVLNIEFEYRSINLIAWQDFRRKYNNVNLINDTLTSWYVNDSNGVPWRAAAWWGPITNEFDHDVTQSDSDNKYAFHCTFNARVHYFLIKAPSLGSIIREIIITYFHSLDPNFDPSIVEVQDLKESDYGST